MVVLVARRGNQERDELGIIRVGGRGAGRGAIVELISHALGLLLACDRVRASVFSGLSNSDGFAAFFIRQSTLKE